MADGPARVLLLEQIHPDAEEILSSAGFEIESVSRALDEDELVERIAGVSLIGIRSKTHITERVLEAADKLVAIGAFCIGTNQIDLDAASERGRHGVQRAVLEHPLGRRAGDRRDHFDDPPAHREEHADA